MSQFTDETKLELLTGASNPDETFNANMEELNLGLAYGAVLDEAGSAGEWFRFQNDGTAVMAQGDTEANAMIAGVLTLDGVQFDERHFRHTGVIEIPGWGLDANTLYYLDPDNAGQMVNAQPPAGYVVELGRSDSTGDKFYIQLRVYLTEVIGGDHSTLANLAWSAAGHTIDTTVDMDSNELENLWQWEQTKEPTGIIDRTESTISFVAGTRTFSIAPTGVSFDYLLRGNKVTVSAQQDVIIADTTGLHYIYFNSAGTLTSSLVSVPAELKYI